MKAGHFSRLDTKYLVKLPSKSELFMLPDRLPVGLDLESGEYKALSSDPYSEKDEVVFAVAAFIPPGFTLTHSSAFKECPQAANLPLFSYAPCVFYEGDFFVSAIQVDSDIRHDERFFNSDEILENTHRFKKRFPKNRLVDHLTICATKNACANAKNFFLGRFEAPIPTSPVCNAQCQGCISFQPAGRMPSTQARIQFVPTPEEIAELALYHFEREPDPIVSFGQGCEGEPSLQGEVIEKAIRLIRQHSDKGSININTNASRPKTIERLFHAGLSTIRVSLNSVREPYYSRYYQPRGYSLKEVIESVDIAGKLGGFVSLNYLSMPGFTDSEDEFTALKDFLANHPVRMIQWRNLNYDPIQYFRDLKVEVPATSLQGMAEIMASLKDQFPKLLTGYFNPKKSAQKEALFPIK